MRVRALLRPLLWYGKEVVSLLRRAGFEAVAHEALSVELKGMVNRKKLALVAAGESRRRIPSTAAIQEWLDQVVEEDPLWGWVFAMVATYGLRPHEVWHIDGLPDRDGLITIGVAARHIKVTKTGFRAAVPLPAEWIERYQLGGMNGEQRLEQLRQRFGDAICVVDLLPVGAPRRDWKSTLLSDGYVTLRHPDWDTTIAMADAVGTDLNLNGHAGRHLLHALLLPPLCGPLQRRHHGHRSAARRPGVRAGRHRGERWAMGAR
jgi:hypothetical protein